MKHKHTYALCRRSALEQRVERDAGSLLVQDPDGKLHVVKDPMDQQFQAVCELAAGCFRH